MKKYLFFCLLFVMAAFSNLQAQTKNALKHPVKVLVLCTGNTCRSQMSHGFFKSYDKNIEIYSGGVQPAKAINPKAVEVMAELGIDISMNKPHDVRE